MTLMEKEYVKLILAATYVSLRRNLHQYTE